MGITFYSKKIFKFLGLSIIYSSMLFETNILNRQIKAEKNSIAASKEDLNLYQGMGVSYLCNATSKGYDMDFSKTLTVAAGTFVSVVQQKHGGVVIEKNKKEKLNLKNLQYIVSLNLIQSALNICPDNVPEKVKKSYLAETEKIKKFKNLKN